MAQSTLWVFAYGSLLWNPGFEVAESRLATLHGYRRSFCMRSIHHRGSVAQPGLVLALDAAERAACRGLALQMPEGAQEKTLSYLRERELVSSAYLERRVVVCDAQGVEFEAVTYVIDPDHVQYCGNLPLEDQAQIIARAVGGRGPNDAYLHNTATRLRNLKIEDRDLNWLSDRVCELSRSGQVEQVNCKKP